MEIVTSNLEQVLRSNQSMAMMMKEMRIFVGFRNHFVSKSMSMLLVIVKEEIPRKIKKEAVVVEVLEGKVVIELLT